MTCPFLTDLDSRAAIKGSRDPLGVQPIWTRFGRHIVGNLTTVTTSVRDFGILLLGYHFAERIAEAGGGDGDLAVFLKWEQLASYARVSINGDWSFRGTERVRKNLNAGAHVSLGADRAFQTLGDQKTYGLWGLYTTAARSSGLVEGEPTRLSEAGRKLVETVYLPIFSKARFRNGDAITDLLKHKQVRLDTAGKHRELLVAVARVLPKSLLRGERSTFREHLLIGGPGDRTDGLQAILAEVMASVPEDGERWLSPSRIIQLAKLSRGRGEKGAGVAERLDRIRTCEYLLAPSAALFDYLLSCDGQTVDEVAKRVSNYWGRRVKTVDADATDDLKEELSAAAGKDVGVRWIGIAWALHSGAFLDALRLLIDQNGSVMAARGGAAPWVEVREGKLFVRFRDEHTWPLPKRVDLPDYWRNSYFLDSLRTISRALEN